MTPHSPCCAQLGVAGYLMRIISRVHASFFSHSPGGAPGCALDAVLAVWLERWGEQRKRHHTALCVTALGLLLQGGHPRLAQAMVREAVTPTRVV